MGAALIKRENEELPKVRAWASELHAGAYSIRGAPTPCAEEREACVKCYDGHDGDGLKCGREVAAYDRCARGDGGVRVGEDGRGRGRDDAGGGGLVVGRRRRGLTMSLIP